jgi:hypothetical protein
MSGSLQKLQFLIGDFCLSFNTELGFLLDQFGRKTFMENDERASYFN